MKTCDEALCRRDLIRYRLLRLRQANLGMPEESPDFSPEDAFDLLEFYQQKLEREERERRQVRQRRRRYLRRQRSLERIVRAVLQQELRAECIAGAAGGRGGRKGGGAVRQAVARPCCGGGVGHDAQRVEQPCRREASPAAA